VMTAPLRRAIIFSALPLVAVLTGPAIAEPPVLKSDVLKDLFGKWFITSYEIAPTSAVGIDETKSYVGQAALFR
jgi:hypothetical protein